MYIYIYIYTFIWPHPNFRAVNLSVAENMPYCHAAA